MTREVWFIWRRTHRDHPAPEILYDPSNEYDFSKTRMASIVARHKLPPEHDYRTLDELIDLYPPPVE